MRLAGLLVNGVLFRDWYFSGIDCGLYSLKSTRSASTKYSFVCFIYYFDKSILYGIIQLLVTTLENPGRFIAIILLILQLVTSAGTFPNELIPEKLQIFNDLLPMAYSVRGFREVISTGNFI